MIYSEPYIIGNLTLRQCTICAAPIIDKVDALTKHAEYHAERNES